MTKKLAIAGKVITFNDLENKSLAQFKQQLKQNGIERDAETVERLYHRLRGEQTAEQQQAAAEAKAKAEQIKAEAEARAEAVRKAAEAKLNK